MKLSKTLITSIAMAALAVSANPVLAKKNGNGGHPGGSGSTPAPVYVVESSDPGIISGLDNHGSSGDQVVWYYDTIDLSDFPGTWSSSGDPCLPHGDGVLVNPTLVIERKSQSDPVDAHVLIWYQAQLESGDSVTNLMTLEGTFDTPDNWPPSLDTSSSVTLDYWEFAAENKKAQRMDCAGSSDYPAGPFTITVTRTQ